MLRHVASTLAAAWLVALRPAPLPAQDWLLLGGLVDLELWATDSGSTLLTRNDGHPSGLVRALFWGGADLGSRMQVLILGEFAAGPATNRDPDANLQQLVARLVPFPGLMVEGGRLPHPVGTFAGRRFSSTNPLIGTPDAYPTLYPWGGQVRGVLGRFDYRLALIDLPLFREGYVPEPTPAWRGAVGVGLTPVIGLRLGGSYVQGPYLNDSLAANLLAGAAWDRYGQRVVSFDAAFSRGYAEFRAEFNSSSYDVPGLPEPVSGYGYYAEVKYTWSPRVFSALRVEQNNYPFIRAIPATGAWIARATNMYNGEVGAGYRLGPSALVKASVRKDAHWGVDPSVRPFVPDGYAIAGQVSLGFDLAERLRRR
jgi:hypothetical protein